MYFYSNLVGTLVGGKREQVTLRAIVLLQRLYVGFYPMRKQPITYKGQPCRQCQTPVVKRIPHTPPKPGQRYRYRYYFFCPACKQMYMVEAAKVTLA